MLLKRYSHSVTFVVLSEWIWANFFPCFSNCTQIYTHTLTAFGNHVYLLIKLMMLRGYVSHEAEIPNIDDIQQSTQHTQTDTRSICF